VALAAIFATAVLVTSFPLSALLAQHRALSAANAQLASVRHEDRLLAEQQRDLNSKTAIDRLARQDYQMVSPGQTLYDVLPPSGQSTPSAAGTSATGDPGTQPLVSPDDAADLSPEPGLTPTTVPASTGAHAPSGASPVTGATGGSAPAASFWSRVSSTLEFWK
jgi:cell division protein FtsB